MKLLVKETVCGADNGNESIQDWCSKHQCHLYDLASDPSENQNLALNPGFAEKLQVTFLKNGTKLTPHPHIKNI